VSFFTLATIGVGALSFAAIGTYRGPLRLLAPPSFIFTPQISNPQAGPKLTLSPTRAKELDAIAANLTYDQDSVTELAALMRPHAQTEAEKARLIYSWITQHIAYDVALAQQEEGRDLRPQTTLQKKQTICSGYAYLYQTLAAALGLEAVIVEGYGRGGDVVVGEDSTINHAWNGVKIGQGWYLVDTTWGAGSVNKQIFVPRFNPFYFAPPPSQFIYSHFPVQTAWQLLANPLPRKKFDALPQISARFFRDGLTLPPLLGEKVLIDGQMTLQLQVPAGIDISAQIKTSTGEALPPSHTLVQKLGTQVTVRATVPSAGNYQLIIFSKTHSENIYYQAIAYDIESSKAGEQFPQVYGTFNSKNAYLLQPLSQSLPLYQATYFQIQVPGAQQVIVLNKITQEWTLLTRQGNHFSGTSLIKPGPTVVVAKFGAGNKYWTLLEYN
jgi:transglutaminase/protease-like cytokinesis protein 3